MAYLSDVIGDKYKNWKKGFVLLKAGTGCGKSHFITNVLTPYAIEQNKKVLYLVNRTKLKEQLIPTLMRLQDNAYNNQIDNLIQEYHDDEETLADAWNGAQNAYWNHLASWESSTEYPYLNLTLMTYQKFESLLRKRELKWYDYIVCDEFHYFINDSSFSNSTELSYKYVMHMGIHKKAIVILMSASPWYLQYFMRQKKYLSLIQTYKMRADYSHVRAVRLYLFNQYQKQIEYILQHYPESRILYFTNNPSIYDYFYKNHNDISCFIANENSKTYKEYSDLMTVGCLEEYETDKWTFNRDKRICITTSVIDNGVSIKDTSINFIFCDFDDISQVVQALGRKRKLENDWCYFYIQNHISLPNSKERDEQYFLAHLVKKEKYKGVNAYIKHNNLGENWSEFFRKYPMLSLTCYDTEKGLYKLTVKKTLYHQLCWMRDQNREIEKYTYMEFLKKYIPELADKICIIFFDKAGIIKLLESYENKIITKEQRNDFLFVLSEYAPNFKNKTISKVNELLKQGRVPYELERKRPADNRGESYWKINKIE